MTDRQTDNLLISEATQLVTFFPRQGRTKFTSICIFQANARMAEWIDSEKESKERSIAS